eukprot:TRINITY_DN352_c2_g3_i1.p1 TRINITY_DN352_c2_g3~~TRINITY_DN352_c2_g3_i1.p1  ORF type:complete len:208 (+),score=52.20 TRINITY_DN352_c2_g3_i1:53-676(+)
MVRFKARYALLEFRWGDDDPQTTMEEKDMIRVFRDHHIIHFGELSLSRLKILSVKFWNPNTSICVVRVSRDFVKEFVTGLFFMTRCKGREVVVHTLHVGGTLQRCLKVLLERNRMPVLDPRFFAALTQHGAADDDEDEIDGFSDSESEGKGESVHETAADASKKSGGLVTFTTTTTQEITKRPKERSEGESESASASKKRKDAVVKS